MPDSLTHVLTCFGQGTFTGPKRTSIFASRAVCFLLILGDLDPDSGDPALTSGRAVMLENGSAPPTCYGYEIRGRMNALR